MLNVTKGLGKKGEGGWGGGVARRRRKKLLDRFWTKIDSGDRND